MVRVAPRDQESVLIWIGDASRDQRAPGWDMIGISRGRAAVDASGIPLEEGLLATLPFRVVAARARGSSSSIGFAKVLGTAAAAHGAIRTGRGPAFGAERPGAVRQMGFQGARRGFLTTL